MRSLRWAFLHRRGRLDIGRVYEKTGALLRGMHGATLRSEARAWFAREVVRYYVRSGAGAVIARADGDSIADLSVLLAVGTPVAVHPDRRLRSVARQRGFRVADWS